MQKFVQALLIIAVSLLYKGCLREYTCTEGSGIIRAEKREIPQFKSILINIPGEIYFFQRDIAKIEIETDYNLHQYITTEVKDSNLIIRSNKNICPKKLKLFISNPYLEGLKINGSAYFIASNQILTPKLVIEVLGSSDVHLDSLNTKELKSLIEGSGDIYFGGYAERFISKINGSGAIQATKMLTEFTEVQTNGFGDIKIWANNELRAIVNGAGNVQYYGSPKVTDVKINGSGKVIHLH